MRRRARLGEQLRAGYMVLLSVLVVGPVIYAIVRGVDLRAEWNDLVSAVAYLILAALVGVFVRRRAERERRERDELVNSILGRDRHVLPPLAERDEFYAQVKIAERPIDHVRVPWHRSWRTLLLVPLPVGVVGAALQGSGWWLLLGLVGLVLAVAHLFKRAVEKEVEGPGVGAPRERLS